MIGLRFLVKICGDLGLPEAKDYTVKLEKASRAASAEGDKNSPLKLQKEAEPVFKPGQGTHNDVLITCRYVR